MRIIGLDLSLTATGVAIIDGDVVDVSTVRSAGTKDASLLERAQRIYRLVGQIVDIDAPGPALVVVEGPALGAARQAGTFDRMGLWWHIVTAWLDNGAPVAEVTPSGLKKYATGKGNADKDAVLLAVARRFPDVEIRNNNEADALILAAMGADHLGYPITDLPAINRAALDAVRWPEAVTV